MKSYRSPSFSRFSVVTSKLENRRDNEASEDRKSLIPKWYLLGVSSRAKPRDLFVLHHYLSFFDRSHRRRFLLSFFLSYSSFFTSSEKMTMATRSMVLPSRTAAVARRALLRSGGKKCSSIRSSVRCLSSSTVVGSSSCGGEVSVGRGSSGIFPSSSTSTSASLLHRTNNSKSLYSHHLGTPSATCFHRCLLSTSSVQDDAEDQHNSNNKLTVDVACDISRLTSNEIVVKQKQDNDSPLMQLANDESLSLLTKWMKMMNIFCENKELIISNYGYAESDEGLAEYTQDYEELLDTMKDDDKQKQKQELEDMQNHTWASLVATCFNFDVSDVPALSLEEARNIMYKINTRMIEPGVLVEIEGESRNIIELDNEEKELQQKHLAVQQVILERVYLDGKPSLLEKSGFCSPNDDDFVRGYAKMQCALHPYRNDPFIAQTTATAMARVWHAATFDSENP